MSKRQVAVISIILPLLAACGGDDGSGAEGIRGHLSDDYRSVSEMSAWDHVRELFSGTAYAVGGTDVDTAVLIPLHSRLFDDVIEATVDRDGQFEFSFAGRNVTGSFLILLINSTAPLEERIVGYVTMGAGSDTMLAFPPLGGPVDVGAVSASGDEAVGDTTVEETIASFSLSLEELLTVAAVDDAYKNVINGYLNYDEASGTRYWATVRFAFSAPHAILVAGPNAASLEYQGFGLSLRTNDSAIDVMAACTDTPSQVITMTPPADVTTSRGEVFGPAAPFSSAPAEPGAPPCDWERLVIGEDGGGINVDVGGQAIQDLSPGGYWRLAVNGEQRAIFDLGVTDPMDGPRITVPVPIPVIETADDGTIESIRAEWYMRDAAGGFALADPAVVERFVYGVRFAIHPPAACSVGHCEPGRPTYIDLASATDSLSSFPTPYMLGELSPEVIRGLTVHYGMAENTYDFYWGTEHRESVGPGPNLQIEDVTPVAAEAVCLGTAFDVTIINTGNEPVTAPIWELVGSECAPYLPPPDLPFGESPPIVTLEPGGRYVARVQSSWPQRSTRDIDFIVDPDNFVAEGSETDNTFTLRRDMISAPVVDLRLVSLETIAPTDPDQPVGLRVTVENASGSGVSAYFCAQEPLVGVSYGHYTVYLDASHDTVERIDTGTPRTFDVTLPFAEAGVPVSLEVELDPSRRANDTDRFNNILSHVVDLRPADTTLRVRDAFAREDAGRIGFIVEREGPSTTTVTGVLTVIYGTAGAADLPSLILPVSLGAGEDSATYYFPVLDDAVAESTESFEVRLREVVGARVVRPAATGRIADDDAPQLRVLPPVIVEGDSGWTAHPIQLVLDAPLPEDVEVTYWYDQPEEGICGNLNVDRSARQATPYVDFDATAGIVTIPAGTTSAAYDLLVRGDLRGGADAIVNLGVGSFDPVRVVSPPVIWIEENDPYEGPPGWMRLTTVSSGFEGEPEVVLQLELPTAPSANVSYVYETRDGSGGGGV